MKSSRIFTNCDRREQQNTPAFLEKGRGFWRGEKPFTLIELLVSVTCQIGVLPLYRLKKNHKNCTSLRPSGRTSRFFCDLAGNGNRKKSSSHLHIFTQSAFTLIELLVVIAIIAILAAILLPALQGARARSQSSSCVNNLKNLATAANSYQSDYSDYFVPYQWDSPGITPPSGKSLQDGNWFFNDFLDPYLKQSTTSDNNSVYLCPSAHGPDKKRTGDGILTMNYGWNQDIHLWLNRTGEVLPAVKSKTARFPSKTFSVMDAGRHRMNWQFAQKGNTKIKQYSYVPGMSFNLPATFASEKSLRDATEGRHLRKTVNSAHVDGHVETYRADDLAVKTYYKAGAVDNNFLYWHPETNSEVIKFK